MFGASAESIPDRLLAATLRVWMRAVVHLHHVLDRKLSVSLRGRQALVAEHLLDGAQVSALLQHVRAEGVPQSVWMNVGREPARNGDLLDDAANAASGQTASAQVDEQRSFCGSPGFAEHSLARRHIALERGFRGIAERDVSLFLAFTSHQNDFLRPADVV